MLKLRHLIVGAAVAVPSASAAMAPSAKQKVVVTAKLADFAIDAKNVGKVNMDGMGHLHFSLDGGKYDYEKYSGANGALAAKLGIAGKYSPSVMYTVLPRGKHTAMVFIVNNNHSNTGSSAKLVFTVK